VAGISAACVFAKERHTSARFALFLEDAKRQRWLGTEAKIRTLVKFAWYASAPKSRRHAVDDNRRAPRRRVFKDGVVQAKGVPVGNLIRLASEAESRNVSIL
jgi:hypothetical protein